MDAMTKKLEDIKLNRREFIIALGGLTGAAIIGWIAVPKTVEVISQWSNLSLQPELLDCLEIRNGDGRTEIYDISEKTNPILVCKVNTVGGSILRQLDGRHSMNEIIQTVRQSIGITPSETDPFASKVALFITGLAEAGFIKRPFFVNLVENPIVS
jgi:hypothetical protein